MKPVRFLMACSILLAACSDDSGNSGNNCPSECPNSCDQNGQCIESTCDPKCGEDQECVDGECQPKQDNPDDKNHNYMLDTFETASKQGEECRKYSDCDSEPGKDDGFCDSFIDFKCSTRCTNDDQCISSHYFCRGDGRCAPKAFVTVWKTAKDDKTIIFPLNYAKNCDLTIDWGDGKTESTKKCEDLTHEYADFETTYTVTVTGTLTEWSLNAGAGNLSDDEVKKYRNKMYKNAKKIIQVKSFGPVSLRNDAFYSSGYLESVSNTDIPDASTLVSMEDMFSFSNDLVRDYRSKLDLSKWDVSNVTNMSDTFSYADHFNGDIGKWDVSNVTTMNGMFEEANRFNGDISQWDVSNVTDMANMFLQAYDFDSDISQWDVSNVTTMDGMLMNTKFNGDISQWNVSNVVHMEFMFDGSEFNGDISQWNVSKVGNMMFMFQKSKFNGDISQWDVSNVRYMNSMFEDSEFNGDISQWDVSNVKEMQSMFEDAKAFNGNISQWDVSNVTTMMHMFKGASAFNCDISQWNVKGNIGDDIFEGSGLSDDLICKIKCVWVNSGYYVGFGKSCTCN